MFPGAFRWLDSVAIARVARRLLFVASALDIVPAAAAQQAGRSPTAAAAGPNAGIRPLVFTSVTVVDVEAGRLVPNQTVTVVGSRIKAVGRTGSVRPPADARVVNAAGKFLIPGLWDMHTHPDLAAVDDSARQESNHRDFYQLFLAQGVTGIREMAQRFPHGAALFRKWQHEILTGVRIGPRGVGPSADLNEANDISIVTPDDARRVVDSLKAAGDAFAKFHDDGMDPVLYFAILHEARRVGLPIVGHVPEAVTAAEASDSGQYDIEHLNEFRSPCIAPATGYLRASELVGDQECAAFAAQFVRNGTWFTPTISVFGALAGRPDDYARYLPAAPSPVEGNEETLSWIVDDGKRLVAALYHARVPLLAGTDGAASVHLELQLLVEAGLPPLEALRTATLNPAKFFHATDSLGTVAPGKLADLVLLDADPLADIQHTRKIRAVVANGRYFDRAALDALLASLAERAQGHTP